MNRKEYQNVYKHISPPSNPGVRTWCGVSPEKHIVDYSYQSNPNVNTSEMMSHRSPPQGCGMGPLGCGYPSPYSPPTGGERIEGFNMGSNKDMLMKLVVLAAVCYLVYYLLNTSNDSMSLSRMRY